jgi:hypothetical protein
MIEVFRDLFAEQRIGIASPKPPDDVERAREPEEVFGESDLLDTLRLGLFAVARELLKAILR